MEHCTDTWRRTPVWAAEDWADVAEAIRDAANALPILSVEYLMASPMSREAAVRERERQQVQVLRLFRLAREAEEMAR